MGIGEPRLQSGRAVNSSHVQLLHAVARVLGTIYVTGST
jgi:hypothetical protein